MFREEYVEATKILRKHNPNPDVRQTDNMDWKESKYSSINGGVSYTQITWLKQVNRSVVNRSLGFSIMDSTD